VTEPTSASVARGLGLPEDLAQWLDSLDSLGPPAGGLLLPRGQEAAQLIGRLGVVEPDLTEIVQALPDQDRDPELWWLLERAYHLVRNGIGDWEAVTWLPSLPPHLGLPGRCFWVFVFLAAAGDVHSWHSQRGIDDRVSWETLADLGRHVSRFRRRTGDTGLDSQFWIGLTFRGALYDLGRLQFSPYRLRTGMAGPLFWYEGPDLQARGPDFQPGAPVLGVHVPAGEPLTPAACDESFLAASTFFRRYFPDRPEASGQVATCTSWLLDEQLADYLRPDSNIVRFQRRFTLVPGAREDDDEVFRFVFERVPHGSLDELSPRTELERALVRHVRDGGHWRVRTGWLEF
jgi:hypothetical protein